MTEFYARAAFLDSTELYKKYNSIVSTIERERDNIDSIINSLKRYSGFGIEKQIANLERCRNQLNDWEHDVMLECGALRKIIDAIKDSENKAVEILGVNSVKISLSNYDSLNSNDIPASNVSKSDAISSLFKDMDNKDLFSIWYSTLSDKGSDGALSFLVAVDKLSKLLINMIKDRKINITDVLDVAKNSISAWKGLYSIFKYYLGDGFDIRYPEYKQASSILTEFSIGITTLISTVEAMNKYRSDGNLTLSEGAASGFEGCVDGIFATIAAGLNSIPLLGTFFSWAMYEETGVGREILADVGYGATITVLDLSLPGLGHLYKYFMEKTGKYEDMKNSYKENSVSEIKRKILDWTHNQSNRAWDIVESDPAFEQIYNNANTIEKMMINNYILVPKIMAEDATKSIISTTEWFVNLFS